MTNSNAETPGGERQRAGKPRRRGRRRRGGGGGGQEAEVRQEQQAEVQAEPESRPERSERPERAPRQAAPQRQERAPYDGPNARGEKGGRNRRRPNRRGPRPMEVTPGEVILRETRTPMAPVQPMRKRKIIEGDTTEPEFGCPMLSRTRLAMPFKGNQNAPRCSVGWAVHDEDEVLFCMHTPSRNLCWKENPEQLEALIEKLRPQIEEELRQQDSVAD